MPIPEVGRLIREAAFAFNALRKATDETAFRRHLEEIEIPLDKVSKADDWTRRLPDLLKRLNTPTAQKALYRLVKAGLIPDAINWCLQDQSSSPSERDLRKRMDSVQKRRTRMLAVEFERLADACDSYSVEADREHIERLISLDTSSRLRDEAAKLRNVARRLDLRLKPTTKAEWSLFETISNIKTITGEFHDDLVAEILSGAFTEQPITPEALRRWRSRQARRWKREPWSKVEDSYRTLIHKLAAAGRS